MFSRPILSPASFSRFAVTLCLLPLLTVSARAQTDGSQKWNHILATSSVASGNVLSSPAIGPDGTVYLGTEVGASTATNPAGRLFAFTPTGALKWAAPVSVPDWIDSTPAVATDGTIYFGCWDGNLYALNPDGTQKWKYPLGSYASASPAIGADGTIYIGTGSGNLYAINPDGSFKWVFPTLYWIEAAPAIAPDGTIYVGSDDNNFYAIKPDGTLKWSYTAGNDIASSAAIASDGTVYVGSRDLKLYAFNPNGTVKWTFQNSDMIDASPVIGNDGTVYTATVGGRLYALNPADGSQKWQYPAAGQTALSSLYSTPAVRADGSIVFGTSDNYVCALKSDGTLLWKQPIGDWADSSPVIAPDGTIYIGCSNQYLYAFNGTVTQSITDWPQLLRTPQRDGYQPLGAPAGTTGRLTNMSVRTPAGSGDNTLIVGFALSGSGSRSLLVRGVGPTLANFSVTGVLADPFLTIIPHDPSAPTLTNDNWSIPNGTAISTAGDALGAFALPQGSLDSAILSSFPASSPPTTQTAQLTGNSGSTGIALLEVYDNGGSNTARLMNISARSNVGTGSGVLITGFVVRQNTRALLIRGIGPSLAPWLSGYVAAPQLRLFKSYHGLDMVVADNTGWTTATNSTAISTAGGTVGAFSLQAGGADSAMLVTLPPGDYTAQVSGVNGTTGIGLVEVYEVP